MTAAATVNSVNCYKKNNEKNRAKTELNGLKQRTEEEEENRTEEKAARKR